jgi:sigma-B regulation protein RsbQ
MKTMITKQNAVRKNNVKIEGNLESDKTIVLGHGFGTDHTAWRFITGAFKDDYKLITYDNVGAGEADLNAYNPIKYSRINSYADDLVDLCEQLGIRDALFIGHSVSGMVGLLASKKAPEFFSKHVFMNASPRYLNDTGYRGGFEQSDLNGLFNAMANNYQAWVSGFSSLAMSNPEKPYLAEEFARTLSAIRPDIALAVAQAIFQSDHRKDLPGFNKESLIIQIRDDIAVPMEVGIYINNTIPNSKLVILDAKGHFPHISAPEEVIQAIKSFIK